MRALATHRACRRALFAAALIICTARGGDSKAQHIVKVRDTLRAQPSRREVGYPAEWRAPGPSSAQAVADAPPLPDAAPAPAAPASETPRFELSATTILPLMVGGHLNLELPGGVFLRGRLGAMPKVYAKLIDGVLTSTGAYDDAFSSLVQRALDGSVVGGASLGLRPFRKHGLELSVGYTFISMGGEATFAEAVKAATGQPLPAMVPNGTLSLDSTLHNLHASIGWRITIEDRVVLRAALGYLQTITSSSTVELRSSPSRPQYGSAISSLVGGLTQSLALAAANQWVDATLDDAFTKYVKTPTVEVSLGYLF